MLITLLIIYSIIKVVNCINIFNNDLKSISLRKTVKVGQLELSPIGCGTWSWGNRFLWQYSKSNDILLKDTFNYVISNGINWFDTADSYGTSDLTGRAEELLGLFSLNSKSKSYICTKIAPYPWRIGSNSFKQAIDESIYRINKPLDMVQLHWPPSFGWQEENYFQAMIQTVNEKKAKQIGISNYGPKSINKLTNYLSNYNQKIYSNQVQFSLLSRYPLTNGLVDTCKQLDIQLIAYSPLALGLLADKYTIDKLPKGPRGILFREFLPSIQPLLNELRSIAKFRNKTVPQVALNWVMQKGFLVLVGIRSIEQAKDNLGAVGWALSDAEVDSLDIIANRNNNQLIQNSFQSN